MSESLSLDEISAALTHLEGGDWQAAHVIVQRDEGQPLACWAHGIVHVMEGDLANAGYWYRRAGRALPEVPDASAEIRALREALDV